MPAARAESEICRFELPKQRLAGAMARYAQVVAVGGQRSSKAVEGGHGGGFLGRISMTFMRNRMAQQVQKVFLTGKAKF